MGISLLITKGLKIHLSLSLHKQAPPTREFKMKQAKISMGELQDLWEQLRDVPITECGTYLDEDFHDFPAGTEVLEVWYWFEEQNPQFSVANAQGVN